MSANDYLLIEQAIPLLDAIVQGQPGLHEVAAGVGLSESHFLRWAGAGSKRLLQFQTAQEAKRVLLSRALVQAEAARAR